MLWWRSCFCGLLSISPKLNSPTICNKLCGLDAVWQREMRNQKSRMFLCREVFLPLPISCQHQFCPWLPGGVSGMSTISRSSADRGCSFVNSHHTKYRWTLYIWHSALSSQITTISLGLCLKMWIRRHEERLYPILQERETAPRCAVPAALLSTPLAGNSHLTSKHLKLDVTNLYAFVCSNDNITLKLSLLLLTETKLQRYLVYSFL